MKQQFDIFINDTWIGFDIATTAKAAAKAKMKERKIEVGETPVNVKVYFTSNGRLATEFSVVKKWKVLMKKWKLYWSPEGRQIAEVEAENARAAKRKAPLPYRKFLGEIYVEEI